MTLPAPMAFDPSLDLQFERIVAAPRERLWAAWTVPERLLPWFTPEPWKTVACEIDLRPGGRFHTVMRSPEGQEFPGEGCYLQVVPDERLVWTNTMGAGYRPRVLAVGDGCDDFPFTVELSFDIVPGGTRYRARVIHADAAGRARHEAMGFHEGWGKALDQLLAMLAEQP
jgi:uncharacterized protein YndB with AHSA1/START domain